MVTRIQNGFRPEHHALLFAWMVRETLAQVGEEDASPVLHAAVRRYGEQRGHRMALRAQANGHDLSMLSWLAYPEWQAGKGEMVTDIVRKRPNVRISIPLCPWYTVWREQGLLSCGTYYCEEIDKSVVRGFNPELSIEVNEIKPHGAHACDMVFRGVDLTPFVMLKYVLRKFIAARKDSVMPWEYHTGHVYKTIAEEITHAFGARGEAACNAALEIFSQRYGQDSARTVRSYLKTDFDRLPA